VIDGTWTVGTLTVPMPDGWEPLGEAATVTPTLEAITFDEVRPSGLVIEHSVLESSGLALGVARAAGKRRTEIIGRAGGEDEATGDPSEA